MTHPDLSFFLRAAREQPEDDLPRLALADRLEENGDLERAEFVRGQCQLARLAPDDPRRREVWLRVRELRAVHADRWLGPLKRFTHFSVFERGLLHLDIIRAEALLHVRGQEARRSEEYLWVTGLRCHSPRTHRRFLRRLARQADLFAGLTRMQLSVRGPREDWLPLLSSPHLGLLTHLDLGGCNLGDEGAAALAGSPYLANLTALGLAHTGISDAGLVALASSPHLSKVTLLALAGNSIVRRCVRSATLPALEDLERALNLNHLNLRPWLDERARDR